MQVPLLFYWNFHAQELEFTCKSNGVSEYYIQTLTYQNYLHNDVAPGTTFILFDSVPGAGNVKRLYESDKKSFIDFLKISYNRVNKCTCGTNGDTVCYNCLCNFRN